MNTNTKKIFEHLNLFSIDNYKQQTSTDEQHIEIKMDMISNQHGKHSKNMIIKLDDLFIACQFMSLLTLIKLIYSFSRYVCRSI